MQNSVAMSQLHNVAHDIFQIERSELEFLPFNQCPHPSDHVTRTAVVLDDLDYLATFAGFDAVARFLKRVANQASASHGTVIVAAGVGTFTAEQFAVLRGSVDRVLEIVETPGPSSSGPTDHVLLTIPAEDVPVALPLVGARHGLLFTTEHPRKARMRYGERFEIVWPAEIADQR